MIRPTLAAVVRRRLRSAALPAALLAVLAGLLAVAPGPAAAGATLPVRWTGVDVTAGERSSAVVSRDRRPAGSTLVLQRRFPDQWRAADRTARTTDAGFVLDLPTDQYGTFAFRVVALRDGSVQAASSAQQVVVSPPYDPLGKPTQFERFSPPTRWDSCRRITWTFYARHAPARGLQQTAAAFRRVQAATGLEFRYVGRTALKPRPFGRRDDGADIIVGWRTRADYATFDRNPQVVGEGGSLGMDGYTEVDGNPVRRAVEGGVVLNASRRAIGNGFGNGVTWGEILIHELGHVMGLDHTDAQSQIMYFSTGARDATWGAGDLAGLARVGDTRGCMVDARRAGDRSTYRTVSR